jgi:hypothetical protein
VHTYNSGGYPPPLVPRPCGTGEAPSHGRSDR